MKRQIVTISFAVQSNFSDAALTSILREEVDEFQNTLELNPAISKAERMVLITVTTRMT